MRWLVRLYPKAWRDRYEEEFVALLADRPPTFVDIVDTVRGAVDAHLNPQGPVEPTPWTHRIPGLLALTAGAMWSVVAIGFVLWHDKAWDLAALIPISMLLMFLSLPGDYMVAHGRRIAIALGFVGACIVGANLPFWGLAVLAGIAGYLTAYGGALTLGAIRAEIGTSARWALLILAIVAPVAISVPAALGFVTFSESQAWILLPYGLAWIFIGARMAIRGAPTIVDPPLNSIEPEVNAA